MNSDDIPDDIWSNVFNLANSAAQIAALVRTSHRFRELGTKVLLRELRWVEVGLTANNIDAWKGYNVDMLGFPRKLTLGVAFGFDPQETIILPVPEIELHDAIYAQITEFKHLHEIVFDGTVISYYTHKILSLIPTLRILTIANCKFIDLRTPLTNYNQNLISTDSQIPSLSITHLSLNQPVLPDPDSDSNRMEYNYFLRFNNIPALSLLSITWTQEVNIALLRFLENFLEDEETWLFPSLAHLDLFLPLLNPFRYLDTISWFLQDYCPLHPRVQLTIQNHDLSEQQISRLQVRMPGLWSYNGPHCILFRIRTLTDLTHLIINDPMTKVSDNLMRLPETLQSLDLKIKDWESGLSLATDIVDMFPTIHCAIIRYKDDRCILSLCPERLEIAITKWDIEALFTVRYRFPTIHSLTIRYGGDTIRLNHRFIIQLGSEILFNLPHLHTLKLVHDISYFTTTSQTANPHDLQPFIFSSHASNNEHSLGLNPSLLWMTRT